MGSTWKCSIGASHMPSAGLHGDHPVLGLGEAHNLTNSSHVRDLRFRICFGIRASRRGIRKPLSKPQIEFGNGCSTSNGVFIPGCVSMSWSQRFSLTTTHTHDNSSKSSSKSTRFDSEEDVGYGEKRKGGNAFQDFGTDGDEPFVNGEYMRLSRGDESDASDLFREERDSQFVDNDVWADDSGSDVDDEVTEDRGAGRDGYGPWESQIGSAAFGSVKSAADSLAIGGKEPVYRVGERDF